MELNVGKEVAALKRLSIGDLRAKYAEVFGEQTNARHKEWLVISPAEIDFDGQVCQPRFWAPRQRLSGQRPDLLVDLSFVVSLVVVCAWVEFIFFEEAWMPRSNYKVLRVVDA